MKKIQKQSIIVLLIGLIYFNFIQSRIYLIDFILIGAMIPSLVFLIKGRKKKKYVYALILILISLFVFEITVRTLVAFDVINDGLANDEFGWGITFAGNLTHPVQNNVTTNRIISAETFQHGFKRWGNVDDEKKIFIIGDSFTNMIWMNNGEEWYSYLENEFNEYSFFVYGNGGYSNYQEYLVVKKFYEQIKPDYILIQFCGNDFYDNSFVLDKSNYPYNGPMRRPYYENGETKFRFPAPYIFETRMYWHSFDQLMRLYEKVHINYFPSIFRKGVDDKILKFEKEKTFEIMKLFSQFDSQIILFSSDEFDKDTNRICELNKEIICIKGTAELIAKHLENGEDVLLYNDGHWNLKGNKIVGDYLVEKLEPILN